MCEFISWIEHDGKLWYLTKNEINSDKGKELLEYCGRTEDLVGHGAIRKYFGFKGGRNRERTDFSDPSLFPAEIVQDLKDGLFEGLGLPFKILTQEAMAEYKKIEQPARTKYKKTIQQAQAAYNRVIRPAWDKYKKIEQQARIEYEKIKGQKAWDEYKKITQPAIAKYEKIARQAWAEYDKIMLPARAEYYKIEQTTFWGLLKDPNNRIKPWK